MFAHLPCRAYSCITCIRAHPHDRIYGWIMRVSRSQNSVHWSMAKQTRDSSWTGRAPLVSSPHSPHSRKPNGAEAEGATRQHGRIHVGFSSVISAFIMFTITSSCTWSMAVLDWRDNRNTRSQIGGACWHFDLHDSCCSLHDPPSCHRLFFPLGKSSSRCTSRRLRLHPPRSPR